MGMVVRTNTMAQNAYRQLGMNNSAVGKSLEKLSSGFRINRAADDASGLAISEKMKAQIKGLEQASANSQDGISLIQTAEGATTEIHNMLNRMVELATKSANGTIQDPVDREAIQQEVNDLNAEITRIAKSTNFNGINLIDGNLSSKGATGSAGIPSFSAEGKTIDTTAATKLDISTNAAISAAAAGTKGDVIEYTINYKDADGNTKTASAKFTVDVAAVSGAKGILISATGESYEESANASDTTFEGGDLADAIAKELMKDKDFAKSFSVVNDSADKLKFTAKVAGKNSEISTIVSRIGDPAATPTEAVVAKAGATTPGADAFDSITGLKNGDVFKIDGKKLVVFKDLAEAQAAKDALTGDDVGKYDGVTIIYAATSGNSATTGLIDDADATAIQDGIKLATGYDGAVVGADGQIDFKAPTGATGPAKATGGLKLQVGDTNQDFNHVTVSVDDLTAKGIKTEGLDVSTQDAAGDSVQTIKDAINQVSTNRANLGSLQNRLEYTINNLDTTAENMTAANSRIRDTDMAKEMMNYTKMNILTQSAQAMLAQANQQPQAILQLLQ